MDSIDRRVTQGWFSRRHATSEAHEKAQARRLEHEADQAADKVEREQERAKRGPKGQLRLLDKRLGKGKGAKKERARLEAKLKG